MLRTNQFMRNLVTENDNVETHLNNSFLTSQRWTLVLQNQNKRQPVNLEYLRILTAMKWLTFPFTVATLSTTEKTGHPSFGKILSTDIWEKKKEGENRVGVKFIWALPKEKWGLQSFFEMSNQTSSPLQCSSSRVGKQVLAKLVTTQSYSTFMPYPLYPLILPSCLVLKSLAYHWLGGNLYILYLFGFLLPSHKHLLLIWP